jgi:large subunit ribosomal protein L10
MPSKKNITDLASINQKRDSATAVVFAHYRGMTVNKLNELRDKVRDAGGEVVVTKNTLLKIAFNNESLSKDLNGPTAAIFAYGDEIAPLKVVAEFSTANELPKLTAGFFGSKALNTDEVVKLSKLPSKKELQAKVVGSLSTPLYGIVNVLQGNIRKLVYVLEAVKDTKSH